MPDGRFVIRDSDPRLVARVRMSWGESFARVMSDGAAYEITRTEAERLAAQGVPYDPGVLMCPSDFAVFFADTVG